MRGTSFPAFNQQVLLDRVYNLSVHMNLPIDHSKTPALWVMNWSRQLESDRIKKSMAESVSRGGSAAHAAAMAARSK